MPECRGCGGYVTPDFIRVFGNNEGVVESCLSCDTARNIHNGGAAGRAGQ